MLSIDPQRAHQIGVHLISNPLSSIIRKVLSPHFIGSNIFKKNVGEEGLEVKLSGIMRALNARLRN